MLRKLGSVSAFMKACTVMLAILIIVSSSGLLIAKGETIPVITDDTSLWADEAEITVTEMKDNEVNIAWEGVKHPEEVIAYQVYISKDYPQWSNGIKFIRQPNYEY